MFCRYCGSELIDGMKECPKCWTPIDENDTPRYVKNETENQAEPEAENEEKTDLKEIFLKENAAEEKAKPEIKEEEKTDKKNVIIAIVALIVAAAIVIVTLGIPNKKDLDTSEITDSDNSEITDSDTSEITYETITFGSYEQDNNTSNGKEKIEWRVLAKEDNRILVISEYAIDCQQYNTEWKEVTLETSSLRKWLNGTFLNNAFSAEEQAKIQSTKVTADANPEYSTNPGNDTTDKVFLLSITEAKKYFSSDEDRKCVPTAYAIAQGAYTDSYFTKGGKATCWWWLRSPGDYQNFAADVLSAGSVNYSGSSVGNGNGCVRPALWIEI